MILEEVKGLLYVGDERIKGRHGDGLLVTRPAKSRAGLTAYLLNDVLSS